MQNALIDKANQFQNHAVMSDSDFSEIENLSQGTFFGRQRLQNNLQKQESSTVSISNDLSDVQPHFKGDHQSQFSNFEIDSNLSSGNE